jgi:Mg-chelatase subunit ChlD
MILIGGEKLKVIRRNKKLIVGAIASIFLLSIVPIIKYTKALGDEIQTKKPVLSITGPEITKNIGAVNEEVKVTYHVQPQPLAIGDVNVISNKEIVLILDTSGSMSTALGNTTRMDALITAATNFINKFSNASNVKIAIQTYSSWANYDGNSTTLLSPSSATDKSTLLSKIKNLRASGGTNSGDGIRSALKILNNSDNARKYVVFMSDGEPTLYNFSNKYDSKAEHWSAYGFLNQDVEDAYGYYNNYTSPDGSNKVIGGNGSNDNGLYYRSYYGTYRDKDGRGLEYATSMAQQMQRLGYSSYDIAYSDGSSADKMLGIANKSGGRFYSAISATAIDEVYGNIADNIAADYSVENVKFNFTLPSNIVYTGSTVDVLINGSTYTKQLNNISYTLNTANNRYEAQPFDVEFNFKASRSGSYTLGQDWNLTYKATDGTTVTQPLNTVQYTASNMTIGFNLQRNLPSYSDHIRPNQIQEVDYTITPQPISMAYNRKPKEIVLVVDSSYSKKDYIKSFIDQFASNTDVKMALVSYGQGATIANFGGTTATYFQSTTNATALKNAVQAIQSGNGANLGDGLRKAMYVLNDAKDVSRSIIVFGENNPNYYTYTNGANGTPIYYETLDNNSPSSSDSGTNPLLYGADSNNASQYATELANIIKNNKNLNITTLCVGDDSGDDVLKSISTTSGTDFNKLTQSQDVPYLYNVLNSDLILNSNLNESLPSGVTYDDGTNSMSKNIKLFYSYDSVQKKYIGATKNLSTNIKSNQVGTYSLAACRLNYYDLEGLSMYADFAPIGINVVNDYTISQGVFIATNTDKGDGGLGESYLYNDGNIAVASSNIVNMGALINTKSGKQDTVGIKINKNANSNVTFSNISAKLYSVNADNTLTLLDDSSNSGSKISITSNTINVPVSSNSKTQFSTYLITYTYTPNGSSAGTQSLKDGIPITNNCSIASDADNDLNYKIVDMPDLF